jgi:hypothetical protein
MKDTTLTIRLPAGLRRRIEQHARAEGRSLSQATERLIEAGLDVADAPRAVVAEARASWSSGPGALAGCMADALVPTLDDFRDVRREMSSSLDERTREPSPRARR